MPDKNWDLFFNSLFQAYLRTSASQSAGVPGPDACPIRIAQDKEPVSLPRVVITHERRPETLRQLYDATFTVTGHFLDDDTNGTDATQAEAWMQKIRQRLADTASLQAYVAALTIEEKTGWQPVVHHLMSLPFKRVRDEDKGHLELSFDFTFTVVVASA
jgi:hypothetical protein